MKEMEFEELRSNISVDSVIKQVAKFGQHHHINETNDFSYIVTCDLDIFFLVGIFMYAIYLLLKKAIAF